jgi:hypothetical protein
MKSWETLLGVADPSVQSRLVRYDQRPGIAAAAVDVNVDLDVDDVDHVHFVVTANIDFGQEGAFATTHPAIHRGSPSPLYPSRHFLSHGPETSTTVPSAASLSRDHEILPLAL